MVTGILAHSDTGFLILPTPMEKDVSEWLPRAKL